MFFLKNYKTFAHITMMILFFTLAFVFTPDNLKNPVYDLVLLTVCFFTSNFGLKASGLEQAIKDELKKI